MQKSLVLAIMVCLSMPAFVRAQEPQSSFQVYLKDKTPESFLDAYYEYEAERKDSINYDATIRLAWLTLFELDRNLEILKERASYLSSGTKFQYANVLLELGRHDEAIRLYDQLNEETPEWSCPWRHRGTALWKKGEYREAVASLQKAIETRKEHYDAYVVLAQVYKDMKQYKKAVRTLEEGLTYYGQDIEDPEKEQSTLDVQFLYLELLKKTGDKAKYQEQLGKLQELAPDDARLKQ